MNVREFGHSITFAPTSCRILTRIPGNPHVDGSIYENNGIPQGRSSGVAVRCANPIESPQEFREING
jgi:hypothetical protein